MKRRLSQTPNFEAHPMDQGFSISKKAALHATAVVRLLPAFTESDVGTKDFQHLTEENRGCVGVDE